MHMYMYIEIRGWSHAYNVYINIQIFSCSFWGKLIIWCNLFKTKFSEIPLIIHIIYIVFTHVPIYCDCMVTGMLGNFYRFSNMSNLLTTQNYYSHWNYIQKQRNTNLAQKSWKLYKNCDIWSLFDIIEVFPIGSKILCEMWKKNVIRWWNYERLNLTRCKKQNNNKNQNAMGW